MSCLDNNAVWVVGYWTRMSHQRNADGSQFKYGSHTQHMECNDKIKNIDRGNVYSTRGTLQDEYRETFNPMTKDWRESLREWENSSGIGKKNKTKKAVHWSKK